MQVSRYIENPGVAIISKIACESEQPMDLANLNYVRQFGKTKSQVASLKVLGLGRSFRCLSTLRAGTIKATLVYSFNYGQ